MKSAEAGSTPILLFLNSEFTEGEAKTATPGI